MKYQRTNRISMGASLPLSRAVNVRRWSKGGALDHKRYYHESKGRVIACF